MRGRVCRNTQKLRLLEAARDLCHKLDRPVCSKDLLTYFREKPDAQPLFLQPLGQVLSKVSRPLPSPAPFLRRVGIVGNMSFYAPDLEPVWTGKLEAYSLRCTLQTLINERMPERALSLIDTRFAAVACNALAGFVKQWQPTLDTEVAREWEQRSELLAAVDLAQTYATRAFRVRAPEDFVRRPDAATLLRKDYRMRMPGVDADRQNVNRHLVRLQWPQSHFFAGEYRGLFSRLQLRCYAAARWPLSIEGADIAQALVFCLGYGTHGLPSGPIDLDD